MAKIKITQTGSPIRRDKTQRATLVGLGLNKMHRTVEVDETPEVLGQIRKVQHLVSVERSGFPWLGATVTVRQTSTMRMPRMPAITEVGEYTYELTRTLNGRQIVSIDGSSTMGMAQ